MKPASQVSGEILNSYRFIGHLKCTATPCVDSQPRSVRRWVKSGITTQGIPDKMKNYKKCIKIKQICLKICTFTSTDHHNSELSMMCRCESRLYTTIENPSYFCMTLSCTEAIQSFISHFNQYSLVDPSWGNIPSWVWQGVSHWFRKLRRRVWHHRHFGNWISWK